MSEVQVLPLQLNNLYMDCLRDFVGISGCGATEPTSGVYVNSLPGITSFMVSKIADREQVTYLGVWNDVQNRALKKFTTQLISLFKTKKKLKIKTVAQSVNLGKIIDDSSPLAAAAEYRGISIEMVLQGNIATLQSSLQVIWLQSISIYSDGVHAGFVFKVFDLDTGELLDTIEEDLAAGWNEIRVAASYDATRIFICYDATAFESVTLSIQSNTNLIYQACCDTIYGTGNCEASINGAITADLATPTVIDKGDNTYGLSAVFAIQCRYDWLVCNNIDLFTTAWQYCLGAELMTERIYSDRENRFTNIDIEKAKELRDEFETGWNKELETVIDGIDISDTDCCIECVAAIQKPYLIP